MQENREGKQMPFKGRDHHTEAFTIWMAGGGIKRGFSYGETDEIGYAATSGKTTPFDVQATILNQLQAAAPTDVSFDVALKRACTVQLRLVVASSVPMFHTSGLFKVPVTHEALSRDRSAENVAFNCADCHGAGGSCARDRGGGIERRADHSAAHVLEQVHAGLSVERRRDGQGKSGKQQGKALCFHRGCGREDAPEPSKVTGGRQALRL